MSREWQTKLGEALRVSSRVVTFLPPKSIFITQPKENQSKKDIIVRYVTNRYFYSNYEAYVALSLSDVDFRYKERFRGT